MINIGEEMVLDGESGVVARYDGVPKRLEAPLATDWSSVGTIDVV